MILRKVHKKTEEPRFAVASLRHFSWGGKNKAIFPGAARADRGSGGVSEISGGAVAPPAPPEMTPLLRSFAITNGTSS